MKQFSQRHNLNPQQIAAMETLPIIFSVIRCKNPALYIRLIDERARELQFAPEI